jgi:hypothetical protein
LFELHGPGSVQQELLDGLLSSGCGVTLYLVGYLADTIWGDRAFQLLHNRLAETLVDGCEHLYGPMVDAARSADQIALAVNRSLDAVAQQHTRSAVAAAGALRGVGPFA